MKGCPFAMAFMKPGSVGQAQVVKKAPDRVAAASFEHPNQEAMNEEASAQTFYDQLGGAKTMAMFVEDFMEGIMGDPELACHHKQFQDPDAMEMLKSKLCAFFQWKLDGAKHYIGRPMPEVHKNLGISDEVFDSACEVFCTSLKKFNLK